MDDQALMVYGPKRSKRWLAVVVLLGIGLLGICLQFGTLHGRSAGAVHVAPGHAARDFGAWICLVWGLVILMAIIRGRPRLTIDRNGLVFQKTFRTRSFSWDRLGQFTLVRAQEGQSNGKVVSAWAPIDPHAARSRRKLRLPDAFDVPLGTILNQAARYRGCDVAGLPAVLDPPFRPVGVPGFRFAWLTTAMLGVFVAVFVLEQRLAITPPPQPLTPSVDTLVAMGGLNRALVQSGEWFRLATAPFLHAGLAHLIGNAGAFLLAGFALEKLTGRAWMFSIFLVGALAGSGMSLLLSGSSVVSVGASGGIVAMLVALFVITFRLPSGRLKRNARIQSARIAIPALLPVSHGQAALHVDYGAHFGGALLGVTVGLLLLLSWRDDSAVPRFGKAARAVAIAGVLCVVIGGLGAAGSFQAHAFGKPDRVPDAERPRTLADMMSSAARLVAAYPRDPVSHFYLAETQVQQGRLREAEQQLRTALSLLDDEPLRTAPAMASNIRGAFALVLLSEDRWAEARVAATRVCRATGSATPAPQISEQLVSGQLCPERQNSGVR